MYLYIVLVLGMSASSFFAFVFVGATCDLCSLGDVMHEFFDFLSLYLQFN